MVRGSASARCIGLFWDFVIRGIIVQIHKDKKEIVTNLYNSGIPEEFIAMQLDLDIPTVIAILKESRVYREAAEA